MKQTFNIPPTFPLKMEFRELGSQLLNFVKPDFIYFSPIREDSAPVYSLHLILKPGKNLSQEELGILENLQKKFPQFTIQWSTAKELRRSLSDGGIYFIKQCYFGHVIYPSKKTIDPLAKTTFNGSTLIRKAQERVDRDFNDFAVQFNTIDFHYYENENHGKATLEIGAIFAKLLNYVETLYGRETTHFDFADQLMHITRLDPEFEQLFHEKNKKITDLTNSMNYYYTEFLEKDDEKINRREFYDMLVLAKAVFKMVHDITIGIIATCSDIEEKRHPKKEILITDSNFHRPRDIALKEVVNLLQSQFQVHSIFLLNMRQEYSFEHQHLYDIKEDQQQFVCTMLLVTKKPVSMSPAELMDLVFNKVGMKVFFIFKILPKIMERIKWDDNNFLKQVINRENCIIEVDDKLSPYYDKAPYYDSCIWSSIDTVWRNRINTAHYLHELTDPSLDQNHEDPIAALAMVQNALIQTCLGMLYVFWEFKPSYTSLPYLIHLCSHFSDFPKEILLSTSFNSRRMFYLLTQAQNHLRFGSQYKIREEDKDNAHKLCLQFIEKAEHITEKRLRYLKIKTYQRARPFHLEKE